MFVRVYLRRLDVQNGRQFHHPALDPELLLERLDLRLVLRGYDNSPCLAELYGSAKAILGQPIEVSLGYQRIVNANRICNTGAERDVSDGARSSFTWYTRHEISSDGCCPLHRALREQTSAGRGGADLTLMGLSPVCS